MAGPSTVGVEIDDLLNCSLCFHSFESLKNRQPKILSCFHTFCSACLEGLLQKSSTTKSNNRSVACPTCRTEVLVPGGKVSKLQTNFYIENINNAKKSTCTVCDRDSKASTYCKKCENTVCLGCKPCHSKFCGSSDVVQLPGFKEEQVGDSKARTVTQKEESTSNLIKELKAVSSVLDDLKKRREKTQELENKLKHLISSSTVGTFDTNQTTGMQAVEDLMSKIKSDTDLPFMRYQPNSNIDEPQKNQIQSILEELESQFKQKAEELEIRLTDKFERKVQSIQDSFEDKTKRLENIESQQQQMKDGRAEATFNFTVENISKLEGNALSPPCMVRNLPWNIMVMPRNKRSLGMSPNKRTLGFYLQCNRDSDLTSWSCHAEAELRILNHKPEYKALSKNIYHLFCAKEDDHGYNNFLSWGELLDPEKGYVKDDKVTFEVRIIKADAPQY